jgi:hypothetical protein
MLFLGYGLSVSLASGRAKQWKWLIIILTVVDVAIIISFMRAGSIRSLEALDSLSKTLGSLGILYAVILIALTIYFYMTLFETRSDIEKQMPAELTRNQRAPVMILILFFVITALHYGIYAKVTERTTTAQCNEILDASEKDACFYNFGTSLNNITFCEKMQNNDLRHAINRDSCYAIVGQKNQDPNICGKIENSETRKNCLAKPQFMPSAES